MSKAIPLTLIGLLLLAGPAQAVLYAEPSRLDLEAQEPGAVIERSITIHNRGDVTTEFALELVRFQGEDAVVTPSHVTLGAGEAQDVLVTIRLAPDEAGGRHDIRLTATEGALNSDEGVTARSAVRLPIIFHVENLKVASLRVEDASEDSPGQATAMVFNHLPHDADVRLHVLLRDQAGREAYRAQAASDAVPPEEHRFLTVPIGDLPDGTYAVEAWAEHGGGQSNRMMQSYRAGDKSVDVTPATIEALGQGRYRMEADLQNGGSVGFGVETLFRVQGPDGAVQEVPAHPFELRPDQTVTTSAVVALPPGLHQVVAVARWDGGEASAPATAFRASEDAQGEDGRGVEWTYVGAGLGAGAGLAVGAGATVAALRRRGA